jgi:MoaA/NifB/PqqE/SkfB family radical SAM enzyme
MTQQDQILSAFKEDPAGFLDFLIANKKLKGSIRACLSQFILENSGAPEMADFIWLPLMPHTLSIVSVKGCCNLACRMCGGSKGKLEYLRAADLEIMLTHAPTAELVILVAGDSEPLMNPELPDVLRVVKAHGANCNIVSNGHLLSDKLIEAMIETQQPSSLNISLDAATPETYRSIRGADINSVIARLTKLRDAKIAANVKWPIISLLMVGMEDNITELPQFVELAATLQADRVHVDHMHGKYSPGDFHLNPAWQDAVLDALVIGRQTGIKVQLPNDTVQIVEDKLALMMNDQPHHASPSETSIDDAPPLPENTLPAAHEASTSESPALAVSACPWLNSVFIERNGELRPCCNTSTPIGNIMDGPLKESMTYLKARIGNLAGKIHQDCLRTVNCAYVQELRKHRVRPAFINSPPD